MVTPLVLTVLTILLYSGLRYGSEGLGWEIAYVAFVMWIGMAVAAGISWLIYLL
jgi:hypothetical protein